MNLIGEGFHPNIITEIKRRQKIHGYRASSTDILAQTPKVLDYLHTRTGWVKMVSSVDIVDINSINSYGIKSLGIGGDSLLAKKFILFNGMSSLGSYNNRGGIASATDVLATGKAYGLGGTNKFGYSPMPGIISANVKTETMGSLKTATIQIKAWNKVQFDIIDVLYMRLGYNVLLEWGYSHYFNGDALDLLTLIENPCTLEGEYFSGKTYYDLLALAIKERNKSYGNYDALIGRVVNFNWTFNRDGSYDITVILRSQGDVIESLKVNTLLGDTSASTVTSTNGEKKPTEEEKKQLDIEQNTELGKLFTASKKTLDELPNPNLHMHITSDPKFHLDGTNSSSADILKLIFGLKDAPINYYIRMGSLFTWMENHLFPQFKTENVNSPIIKFNVDTKKNLVYVPGYDYSFSTKPEVCLIRSDIHLDNDDKKSRYVMINDADPYITETETGSTLGQIMNIYLNFKFLLGIISNNVDKEGRVSLIKFLQEICNGINTSLGHINALYPTIDETTGEIIIRDQTSVPGRDKVFKSIDKDISTELVEFELFGYSDMGTEKGVGSFIQDFSLKTSISPQFASMITIGATSNGYVVGEDATILSRINRGLKDRVKPEMVDADEKFKTAEEALHSAEVKFLSYAEQLKVYIKHFFSKIDASTIPSPIYPSTDAQFLLQSTIESGEAYTAISASLSSTDKNIASNKSGFIPFNMSLTMDGLSGMKVYQKFTVTNEYLPTNYPNTLEFIVTSINNNLQDNKWITNIESLALPKHTIQLNKAIPRLNDTLDIVNNAILISQKYQNIVEKIIKESQSKGIYDKQRLTAILTVAYAESTFTPSKTESFIYNDVSRAKGLFSAFKNMKDDEVKKILTSGQTHTANFIYKATNGNNQPGDGWLYRGRGLTQTTGRSNYIITSKLLNNEINFLTNPDKLLEEDVSIKVLVAGKIAGTYGDKLRGMIKTFDIGISKSNREKAAEGSSIDIRNARSGFNEWSGFRELGDAKAIEYIPRLRLEDAYPMQAVDYINRPNLIMRTQNRSGTDDVLKHYSESLTAINNTTWIQNLLTQSEIKLIHFGN